MLNKTQRELLEYTKKAVACNSKIPKADQATLRRQSTTA
jgi:hypothetical protein